PPWNSNQANPVVFPDSTKTYHLSLTDGFNTVQASIPVMVNQLPSAHLEGGDTLCGEGGSAPLTVSLTGSPPWSFWYSNGITTWFISDQFTSPYLINATEPGIYTLLAMADAHCTGNTSGSAPVAVFPVPPTPEITVNGNELFSSGCCGNQWYKEGVPIPGATGQVYRPLASAHYLTVVTVNGCESDSSNVIYFFMEGVKPVRSSAFVLVPNPATRVVSVIPAAGSSPLLSVHLYSVTGVELITRDFAGCPDNEGNRIDISSLSPGLYLVQAVNDSGSIVMKMIVE
ncbi:MAG TPA: T9SS type A sorting domain-containing protein, partial [Bacteroidales bacterium]|nr:T9SS type A sorting domain-containing protein [Bacteroidales bacterium]